MAMEKPTNSACMGSRLVVSVSKATCPVAYASAIQASRRGRSVTVSYCDRSILVVFTAATAAIAAACGVMAGEGGGLASVLVGESAGSGPGDARGAETDARST